MMSGQNRVGFHRLAVAMTILLAGCRAMSFSKPPVDDVSVDHRRREAVMIEEFERKRTHAEYEAARAARERGDARNCQAILEPLLRRDPGHRDARLLLSRAHFDQGRPADAIAQLETAVADFPNDAKVHEAMGLLLESLGRKDEAWAHLDRARNASSARERFASGSLTNGSPNQISPPPTDAATPAVIEASHLQPVDGGVPWKAGSEANRLLDDGETALINGETGRGLAFFRDAAASDPNNPQIPTAAAVAALRHGCFEVATIVAEEALARTPQDPSLLRVLGVAYYRRGYLDSSQLVLRQALSLDKSDALAYFLLGCTYNKLEQFEEARDCFAEARRIDPRLTVRP